LRPTARGFLPEASGSSWCEGRTSCAAIGRSRGSRPSGSDLRPKDDIIKTRGEKVAPKEVENALYALPGIRDAAVVGQPHESLGHAIRAFVVLEEGTTFTAEQVIRHCAEKLEPFMVPKWVTFLSSVPKTSSGKIAKSRIQEHATHATVGGYEG
jgi:acyl-coenzyme A synthetase/AMP-(fatty) acid ligase